MKKTRKKPVKNKFVEKKGADFFGTFFIFFQIFSLFKFLIFFRALFSYIFLFGIFISPFYYKGIYLIRLILVMFSFPASKISFYV